MNVPNLLKYSDVGFYFNNPISHRAIIITIDLLLAYNVSNIHIPSLFITNMDDLDTKFSTIERRLDALEKVVLTKDKKKVEN